MSLKTLALILGLAGLVAGSSQLFAGGSEEVRTSYFANGNPKESVPMQEHERHGLCRRWYRDGTLRAEGEYELGVMVGEWAFWDEDGELDTERSGYYVAGRRRSD